jgi:hypothetical protein
MKILKPILRFILFAIADAIIFYIWYEGWGSDYNFW